MAELGLTWLLIWFRFDWATAWDWHGFDSFWLGCVNAWLWFARLRLTMNGLAWVCMCWLGLSLILLGLVVFDRFWLNVG